MTLSKEEKNSLMYLQKRLNENPEKVTNAKELLGDRCEEVLRAVRKCNLILKARKSEQHKEVCEVLNNLRYTFVLQTEGRHSEKCRHVKRQGLQKEYGLGLQTLDVSYAFEMKKQKEMGVKAYFDSLKNEEMISFAELYCLTNQKGVRPESFFGRMKKRNDIIRYGNRYFLPNPFHPENSQEERKISSEVAITKIEPPTQIKKNEGKGQVKNLLKKVSSEELQQKKVKALLRKTKNLRKKFHQEIEALEIQIKNLSL